ncbi:GNAT family N-acetyltransferase [Streptomyces sp. NPDC126510]|uniref:GNAT family N-acetyltransferase n=1 Tax=Streptomyces sp. NPDC126510 TaxID=3155317 RepID=UPI0033249FD0
MTAEPLQRLLAAGRPAAPEACPVLLRAVHEHDLPELLRLEKEVFSDLAYPAFLLRQLVELYAEHFLVLDDGTGNLHGHVVAGTPALSQDAWILALCVARGHRGHGLGRELMAEILTRLRRTGIERVRLTLESANRPAVELYRSLGFSPEEPEAEVRRDYFGPGQDRLVMSLGLGPGVPPGR